jgi:hypothetical protein
MAKKRTKDSTLFMGSNGKVFNALVYPFVTSMNKDDMSSLKDKVGALIHESRECVDKFLSRTI